MITWEGTDVAYCHNGVVLATVEVDRSWKGDVTERVEISTPSSGGACGVDLRVGGEYLIYGKRVSGTAVLSTEVCDGSRHVAYAKQHLAALGKPMRNLVLERQNSLKKSK
jgi:hypothetical protein